MTLCTLEDRHFQSKPCGTFSLSQYIPYIIQSIKHGLQYIGPENIDFLHRLNRQGYIHYEIRSAQSQKDGNVHDLYSYENSHI